MPTYISEFKYYGVADEEFIEVAVPAGTDVSGYSIVLYDGWGSVAQTFSLGTYENTIAGHDVYVLDDREAGWSEMGGEGELVNDAAIALVDDSGSVVQFLSYWGNTVTAVDGPATGMTSTDVGTANGSEESTQSDDAGASYYEQVTENPGVIPPACYAPGTLIPTRHGDRPIEMLQAGDEVLSIAGDVVPVIWVWRGDVPIDDENRSQSGIYIPVGALGQDMPNSPLIVSAQHRIALGGFGQYAGGLSQTVFVPAKALLGVPGIRALPVGAVPVWHHILCENHRLIRANGAVSETMLAGPMVQPLLPEDIAQSLAANGRQKPALPCLTMRQARESLAQIDIAA